MKNTYQYSSINQLDEGDGIVSKKYRLYFYK